MHTPIDQCKCDIMSYVLVKGGSEAIKNAQSVVDSLRNAPPVDVSQIKGRLRLGVDQVMGEGGLYALDLASVAIKQADGDLIEASFLIRAYRSTLPRIGYSEISDTGDMFVIRSISSAFKEIPGGQILGPSIDYTTRLLDLKEHVADEKAMDETDPDFKKVESDIHKFKKISDILRVEGLLEDTSGDTSDNEETYNEPFDITRESLRFPAPRSARLQALARGETGAMLALAYSSLRGYGSVHPTIAQLRVGYVSLRIKHPLTGNDVSIGEVLVTECEGILSGVGSTMVTKENKFSLGYGLVFGHNEKKAISMSILDGTMGVSKPKSPAEDQEFVLYHIDGIDAMGFVEHLKLPHYVTFQSSLDRIRALRREVEDD
ncbi:MAG: carbon-phosphorus lyase complex subunit PhnI [Euryarchaeota archaeon]|nr:carbon-phosphorus lyase complex subunit PhnI [Euryarchaeota archaeon]